MAEMVLSWDTRWRGLALGVKFSWLCFAHIPLFISLDITCKPLPIPPQQILAVTV